MSISDVAGALRGLDLALVRARMLQTQAEGLADAVRAAVSRPVGSEHSAPWVRTGGLAGSVGVSAGFDEAVVGSTSEVARYQELGTATVPPRPFLAPACVEHGAGIAQAVGGAVARAIGDAIGGRR